MVNGFALRRAATAAQAQAASTKNPTPVHSEDLQPNETLRKRKGVGLPPVVATTSAVRSREIGPQMARRGGRRAYGGRDGPSQPSARVERGSAGHVNNGAVAGEYRQVQWKTQEDRQNNHQERKNGFVPFEGRRPRPIPLPIPSSQQRDAASANSNEERTKPFTIPLPALKPKAPLSGLSTTLVPRPASTMIAYSQAEEAESRSRERSQSPKRRKVDLTPEFVSPISSNMTRGSVITNASPLCGRPLPLPLSPSSLVFPEQKTSNDRHTPSPALPSPLHHPTQQAPATPPIRVKREPESPPLPSVQRKSVSSLYQFYPFPENCNRTHPKWEANRIEFRKAKERELKARGLELIGKWMTRSDGITIQWKCKVPVWADTLEPVSPEVSKGSDQSKTDLGDTDSIDILPTLSEVDAEPQSPNVPMLPALSSSVPTSPTAAAPSLQRAPQISVPSGTFPAHDVPKPPSPAPTSPTAAVSSPQKAPQTSVPSVTTPHPVQSSPAPPSVTADAPSSQKAPPTPIPPTALVSPSPNQKPQASPKRKRQPVPRASLDLATAIQLSQRNNASPKSSPRRRTTSSSGSSPAAKRLPSLGPSLSKVVVPPELPSKPFKTIYRPPGRRSSRPEKKTPVARFGVVGTEAVGDDATVIASARAKSPEPVLGETSGWTVIQVIPEESSDRIEEDVEEEQEDQLVEDEEDELLRDEMEAAEVASIGTAHDESDDERDQVESEAIPSGPGQVLSPVVPSQGMKDADLDGLSRVFLTRYMQLYETDRAVLISAYAPDAKFIYRVCESSPISPDPALSSPALPQSRGYSFPLRTARGHPEISSSLHDLQRTHFSQKLDEDGNKKVDVEFWSEQSGEEIWLYVRSIMTVEDVQEPSRGEKWTVDHCFLLRRGAKDQVSGKDDWPVVAHVHQLVMHEQPL
ncbi:hypothetical protein F5887DRAFT_1083834 [Amanita rubescens]|nr:hypothetical protein F5887DRAFT_1083834 [Amanita rubescens]